MIRLLALTLARLHALVVALDRPLMRLSARWAVKARRRTR